MCKCPKIMKTLMNNLTWSTVLKSISQQPSTDSANVSFYGLFGLLYFAVYSRRP